MAVSGCHDLVKSDSNSLHGPTIDTSRVCIILGKENENRRGAVAICCANHSAGVVSNYLVWLPQAANTVCSSNLFVYELKAGGHPKLTMELHNCLVLFI